MPAPRSLWIPARTDALARVRRRVAAWGAEAGLSDRRARRLVLAVDEACANAIEHGLKGRPDGRLTLRADVAKGRVEVVVRHRAARFDPTAIPHALPPRDLVAKAVARRAAHGYGLPLLNTLVDEVSYRWDRGTNELRLVAGADAA